MQERIQPPKSLTFEEFFAFEQSRPDEERWELFDGEAVLQASSNNRHQRIVANVTFLLALRQRQQPTSWSVLPGLGVHDAISDPRSAPLPDMVVRPRSTGTEYYVDDVIVAFEVLSPSTKKRDLVWKLNYYSGLAAMQHYVIIAQDEPLIRHYARAGGWNERKLRKAGDVLALTSIEATLSLAEIYRDTGLIV
jgi:Uma2 family endonuclease